MVLSVLGLSLDSIMRSTMVLEDSTPVSSTPGPGRARSALPENANTGMAAPAGGQREDFHMGELKGYLSA
jgi:hypothetical protein